MSPHLRLLAARGFTLLEVMIAIVVVAFGLLGLAKMQAAVIANTQVSSLRSLLAFQAASLAAVIHGNRAFWAAGTSTVNVTTSGQTVTDTDHRLDAAATCDSQICSPVQLAAYDVQQWAVRLNERFPSATSSVSCTRLTSTAPVACTIALSWDERYLAINAATAASASAMLARQTLTLQVMP